MMILMRFDSEMPMVEDVCLQRLDAGVGPTVGAAPVWAHLSSLVPSAPNLFHTDNGSQCF